MGRVLLTGATGFVGRHALPALASRGFEVHAVTRGAPPTDARGVPDASMNASGTPGCGR